MAGLARAFGSGAMTNSIPDIEESDCILITGSNTTEAHPLIASRVFKAKERGAKLIVIEPRRIQLAYHADLYIRQRPGTDVAWINGMMNVILANGWENKQFIQDSTEGFDGLKAKVQEYPPEKVEQITGIPRTDLAKAAEMYAKSGKSAILYAMGITQHTSGTDNVLSLANLAMLTGNIGRRGTGVNPLRGQNNVQGACDMGGLPNVFYRLPERHGRSRAQEVRGCVGGETGREERHYAHGNDRWRRRGQNQGHVHPRAKTPWYPTLTSGTSRRRWRSWSSWWWRRSSHRTLRRMAHVVLPGASWAEKDGTFSNTDRRVQLIRKAVEPPGEARPDWQVLCDIAKKMGGKGFDFDSPSAIFDEMARLTPSYAGMSYARLTKNGGLQWPCRTPEDPGTKVLHAQASRAAKGFLAPSISASRQNCLTPSIRSR